MKFINSVVLLFLVASVFSCQNNDISKTVPVFGVVKRFSGRIEKKTGLVLDCYGMNNWLPKDYKVKNGIANLDVTYRLRKTRPVTISLEEARCLLISVAESFLHEINSDLQIRKELDTYPLTQELLEITIYFVDENDVRLGTGVSTVYFSEGHIKYKGYQILEYRKYSSLGKDYTIHKESYAEALDIVKQQNCLRQL